MCATATWGRRSERWGSAEHKGAAMAMSRSRIRTAWAALLTAVLLVAGPGVAPAMGDDPPPLAWTNVDGYPKTIDGVTVTWQTASSTTSPFGESSCAIRCRC
nr:hypothetical protein GCM10025699_23540 [Microbacterium flavescens]